MARRASGSSAEVASSISSTSGSVSSARAMHALRLASREVVGGAIEERGVEHDTFEHSGEALVGAVRIGDEEVVADRAGEERGALEHHAHLAPEGQGVEVGDVLAPEQHPAAGRHLEPVAQPQQGRLARPRRSHATR